MRAGYYRERLSGGRLFRCYEVASDRIRRYLDAEVEFVVSNVDGAGLVLELGCGYGRVMKRVSGFVGWVFGNDVSRESLDFARLYMEGCGNYDVFLMDASQMSFRSCVFDVVFCIQNGISAFAVDKKHFIAESVRVTKIMVLFFFPVILRKYGKLVWSGLGSNRCLVL